MVPKLSIFFLLLMAVTSCKRSANQPLRRLDIRSFEKHQAEGVWEYKGAKGEQVQVRKESDEYWEEIIDKGDCFTHRNNYDLNGRLNFTGAYFHESGFNKGIWTYYDRNGKVIRTEDYDAPFKKYPWERVLVYLKRNRVDLLDKQTYVYNVAGAKGTFWALSWKTGKTNSEGFDIIKHVRLDVGSGHITVEKETYCCID